jgi:hypothetical protein
MRRSRVVVLSVVLTLLAIGGVLVSLADRGLTRLVSRLAT